MNPSRLRLIVILAGVAAAGLTLLSWTQPWFQLTLEGDRPLTVRGQSAAPSLSALALASLALVGALSIAGRGVRIGLGVIEVAIGAIIVAVTVTALQNPVAASGSVITDTTAIGGPQSIAALVQSVVATLWPWVGVFGGLLVAAVGVGVLVTGRRWPGPTRKYETTPSAGASTAVDAWDSLSEGSDPTR